jgi:DNA-binding transcriptional LysR family regulator
VRLGSFDAVCRMVGAGVGVAVIPQTAAQRCRRNTAIRVSRLADPWALRRLHVCVRSPTGLLLPARVLLKHLQRRGEGRRRPSHAAAATVRN